MPAGTVTRQEAKRGLWVWCGQQAQITSSQRHTPLPPQQPAVAPPPRPPELPAGSHGDEDHRHANQEVEGEGVAKEGG
jgi:hypothetical protein